MNNDSNELLTEETTALVNIIKDITNQQDITVNLLNSLVENKAESRLVLPENVFLCFIAVLISCIYLQTTVDELHKQILNLLQIQRKSNMNVKQSRMMKKKSRAN